MPGRIEREGLLNELWLKLWGWIDRKLQEMLVTPPGGVGIAVMLEPGDAQVQEELRQRAGIVAFAREQIGKPYVFGVEITGRDGPAWDCSELVEAAYRSVGLSIPDGARFQFDACQAVPAPKAGDLGFLWDEKRGAIGHVMIHTGEGTVVHAVGGRGVVEDLDDRWAYHERFRGWRRHVDFARPQEDRIG